jgi:hypothetical protein
MSERVDRPYPSAVWQILGLFGGIAIGLALGIGATVLAIDIAQRSQTSSNGVFLLVTLSIVQFGWVLPLAWLGWRRRNVGFLVGVVISAVPLLVFTAICGGAASIVGQRW